MQPVEPAGAGTPGSDPSVAGDKSYSEAAITNFAKALAAMYNEMLADGVPREDVIYFCDRWLELVMGKR